MATFNDGDRKEIERIVREMAQLGQIGASGGSGAVQSVNGQTGSVAIDLAGLGGVASATYATNRATDQAVFTTQKLFNVVSYGAVGDGSANDTSAFQAAINACRVARGKLIIPAPSNYYKITSTLSIVPISGAEVYMDIEAQGQSTGIIVYSGVNNTSLFYIKGLRFSTITGLKIKIANGVTGAQCFDLDTDVTSASTAQLTFKNILCVLGNGVNNSAWRLGHVSGGGADISSVEWENCQVFGNPAGTPVSGQVGWLNEGPNTLQNIWRGGFGAILDKMVSSVGATHAGGSGMYFYGLGGSQNNIDYQINNSGSYVISGGRFEVGHRFLDITNANDAPTVTVTGVELGNYIPSDNVIFYIDRPCSVLLQNIFISRGNRSTQYDASMIKCFGGGGGAGKGTLIIDGGSIDASDPFYSVNLNSTVWNVYVRGVGRVVDGIRVGMMTEQGVSVAAASPYIVPSGNNLFVKNDNGLVILQAQGNTHAELSGSTAFWKSNFLQQGGYIGLDGNTSEFQVSDGTNASGRFKIASTTGYVGIGKGAVAPSEKLDVTGNGKFSGNVTAKHFKGNSAAPTIAAGGGMGTSPTGLSVTGNDSMGIITFTTGTTPTTGVIATITFNTAFTTNAPTVLTDGTNDGARLNYTLWRVGTRTTTTFQLINTGTNTIPAATTFIITYKTEEQ